jgi:hypothetical protein
MLDHRLTMKRDLLNEAGFTKLFVGRCHANWFGRHSGRAGADDLILRQLGDAAAFYARRGEGLSVAVAVEVPLDNVALDGKDFPYIVFQLWDRGGHRDHKPEVR